VHRVEIDAGGRSNAGLREHAGGEGVTVVGEARNVGVKIKRAVDRQKRAQARGWQPFDQNAAIVLVAVLDLFKLVAAVEGWALGGGFEMALGCDLIVAAEDAKFGLPEVKRGLIAGEGGVIRLPQRIPFHVAMTVLLTGEPLSAVDAKQYGLVKELSATGAALAGAHELARRIAGNAPLALAKVKQILRETQGLNDAEAFKRQAQDAHSLLSTEDAREGALAFVEKRAPVWRGR